MTWLDMNMSPSHDKNGIVPYQTIQILEYCSMFGDTLFEIPSVVIEMAYLRFPCILVYSILMIRTHSYLHRIYRNSS